MTEGKKEYKTEADFCEDVTKLILALYIGTKREIVCVPEIPFGYFSNEQIDMLLLDVKNFEYLTIEYKLNGRKKLESQISRAQSLSIPCIGVINTNFAEGSRSYYQRIFGYTGKDSQIECLARNLMYNNGREVWRSIYHSFGMVFYWAYKNSRSSFKGGITGGGRKGFALVYQQAIQNLHKEHNELDFMLTHAILGSGYSVNVSKKYYKKALSGQAE